MESIDVFPSWIDSRDSERVTDASSFFDKLWKEEVPGIIVYQFPEASKEILRMKSEGVQWKELLEEQSCHTERLDDGTWAYDCAGTKLKATDSWDSKEEERENALGFSVTGAGILFDETDVGLNEATFFWSATDTLSLYAFAALFQDNENTTLLGATEKENGYSVRCVKGAAE